MTNENINYFIKNKYVIVKNFLNTDISNLAYNYCKLKVSSMDKKYFYNKNIYDENWDGTWNDIQCKGTYSCYGDVFFDSLLLSTIEKMCKSTSLDLIPTYSYWRFYEKTDILQPHIDRESCEISATIPLGFDYSNLNKEYNWSFFVKNLNNETTRINLNPGDCLIYSGCEIEHWREKFLGNNQAQVFLHYNIKNGKFNNLFDGRETLGIPKKI